MSVRAASEHCGSFALIFVLLIFFDFFQDQAAKDMKKLEEKEKEKNMAK